MMVALLLVGLAGCQQAPDGQAGSETQAEDGRATRELFALGSELDEAVEIAPGVFQARGTGNAHAVVTEDGVVVIDTGLSNQPRVQEQLRRAAPGKVSHVILTHAHADHYSATDAFADEVPYAVGVVALEEGGRVLGRLELDGAEARIGMAVAATFVEHADWTELRFAAAEPGDD